MNKTPGCQLCESGVPKFSDDEPTIPPDWPKFHLICHGATAYNIPCNAEEREKMRVIQERLVKAELDSRESAPK